MKFFDLFKTGNKTVLSNAAADGSRPELTVHMAEKILGEKVQNMAMYNLKTLKPLKDIYNNQKIIYGGQVSYCAEMLMDAYKQRLNLNHKKPMWVVAKTVSAFDDRAYDLLKPVPEYDMYGRLVIGNVIVYDFAERKYTTLYQNGSWIRVHKFSSCFEASKEAISKTIEHLCNYYVR